MKETFTWFDYSLFLLMLMISAGTGIYYGLYKKQKTAADFLLGGRQMSVGPIVTSLISSSLSGLALLSLPADIYRYGATYLLSAPLMVFIMAAVYFIYVPVFYKLQVTSTYEYFKIRFNNNIRMFTSVLFVVHMILLLPIMIYVPSLALSQVTGISVHYITPVVCGVCIFYTTLGGIKAAVWIDTIQFGIMLGSLILVVAVGIVASGGFAAIYEKSSAGGRMTISFDLTVIKRDTFWSGTIATFFGILNHHAVNQSFIQKCLSLPSFKDIKLAMILTTAGIIIVTSLSMFSGLVMFAKYFGCDPLQLSIIKTYDQLLPMYVMEEASFIPGLPGLFISGIFSAALSALSASLNCLAAVIYEDFISPMISKNTSQEAISTYLKLLVVVLGVLCTVLVFVVEKLGGLLALTISVSSVTGGPLLGLFTAGMLIPMVNSKGALCGGVVSLLTMSWIILTSQWYKYTGAIKYPVLPVSTENCTNLTSNIINATLTKIVPQVLVGNGPAPESEPPLVLYRISFYYYTMMGVFIVIFVSVLVSYFTKADKPVNKDCISPVMQFLVKEVKETPPQYHSIEKAIELTKN